jgi:thiol-disulfide isomerase/thioredoxin
MGHTGVDGCYRAGGLGGRLESGRSKIVISNGVRKSAVLASMAVAVTLLIWAGVHNGRERRLEMQRAQEAQASKVALVPAGGDGAPPDGLAPDMKGKPAPAFTLVDLQGKKVSLSDFKGKPVLVTFWATWCGPCKLEMPWLEEFSKKYAGQGLVTLGIATDEVPKSVVSGVLQKAGVTYPTLLADDKVMDAYGGVGYVPQSFYVGRDGKIVEQTAGLDDNGKDEIEANIKKLVGNGQ